MENISMTNKLVARYAFINKTVNNIYIEYNINSFPIDIELILKSFENIRVQNYSDLMLDFNLTASKTINYLSSEDGCCVKQIRNDRFLIFINDLCSISESRKIWTVAHEFGHIALDHTNLKINNYSEDEIYKFKEHEANYFASIFLAHPAILKELNIKTPFELEVFCNLSKEAAAYRYKSYKKYSNRGYLNAGDKIIKNNFKNYIEEKNNDYNEHLKFINAFYF